MTKTKTSFLLSIIALASAAVIVGCGCESVITTHTDSTGNIVTNATKTLDVPHIASIGKQAATVVTAEVLTARPELRSKFELAESDLRTLATSPSIGLQDILNIAERLPIKELNSQDARYAFEGATIIIAGIKVPELPADKLAQLQPIALAIADGINTGIANAPAVPAPSPIPTTATVAPAPASK